MNQAKSSDDKKSKVRCTIEETRTIEDIVANQAMNSDLHTASGGNGSDESVRETKTPQKREVQDAAVTDAHRGQLRDAPKQTHFLGATAVLTI